MRNLLLFLLILIFPVTSYSLIIDNGGGAGGPGSDTTAIHVDTADEFDTAPLEGSPNSNDKILIESDGNSDAKRYITIGTLPTGSGMASFDVSGNAGSAQTITNGNNLSFVGTDNIVTTASATDTISIGIDAATRSSISDIAANTAHITSDGTDHSNVVLNDTHRASANIHFTQASITTVGTIGTGVWQGTAITDTYVADDLTISGGTIDNSIIGGGTPAAGTFTTATATTFTDGTATITGGAITGATINEFTNFVGSDEVHKKVFNNTGGTLLKGTPVYISGYNAGQAAVQVTKADSDNAAAMPAAYLMETDVSTGSSGHGLLTGVVVAFDTSAWSVGDEIYVSDNAGSLTNIKPTGTSQQIQKVGIITRSHPTLGIMEVFGAGRANDVPNQANFTGSVTANVLSDGTISITGGNLTGATGVTATNLTGTLQTASQTNITAVGTIATGVWSGTSIVDAKVDNDLTIAGGTIGTSAITLVNSAGASPTTLAIIEYDSTDEYIVVGDGTNTQKFSAINTEYFACSDEDTDLTTGTAKLTFHSPNFDIKLTDISASLKVEPVGATLNVDVNDDGGSIFSTVLTIDPSELTSETATDAHVFSSTVISANSKITIDIDQIGSSTAGDGLKVRWYWRRN